VVSTSCPVSPDSSRLGSFLYRGIHPAPHTSLDFDQAVPLMVLCVLLGFVVMSILLEITEREMTWLEPILKDLGERRVGWYVFVFCIHIILTVICIAPLVVPVALVIWVIAKD